MPDAPRSERHEFTVEANSDVRLDALVAQRALISRTRAATLIATGQVVVTGRREKASYRPVVGDCVVVTVPAPATRAIVGEEIPVPVAYEDEEIVVVDKPAGMVVHPAPGNWSGTLVNALLGRVGGGALSVGGSVERPGIVHRLDKDTSGLLLVAKTERAHRALSAAIAARRVVRRYAALSWGHLTEDEVTIDRPVARDQRDRTRMAVVSEASAGGGGKVAKTTLLRLARFDSVDLLRVHLHTGRTHQIRVHLAAIGHPVVGDDTYGGGGGRRLAGLPPKRHFLHAAWLRLRHPVTGAELDVRSPLPPDLRASLITVADDPSLEQHQDLLDHFGFFRHAVSP